jgi:hypothetical protein
MRLRSILLNIVAVVIALSALLLDLLPRSKHRTSRLG